MDWEKIFANHIFGKGLASTIYKETPKLSNKLTQFFKWANNLSRYFIKVNIDQQISTGKDAHH